MPDSDAQLVARTRSGDQQAFADLVRRHRTLVFRLAVSILGQEFIPEAEDVTQEVFLKVHHAIQTFRGESEFTSWLYRITFNQAVNLKQRVRFRDPHEDDTVLLQAVTRKPSPQQQMEISERDKFLAECIATLPEVYQSSLRLYYWLDTSIAEIAELLATPENTIKSYLYRARQLLNTMLRQRGYSCE